MKFKKEELEFLEVFNSVSDTKLKSTDKVKLKSEKDQLVFSLTSSSMTIVKKVKTNSDEIIDTIFPIGQFNQLVRQAPKDLEISISNEGIKFSNSAEYKFSQDESIQLTDSNEYFAMLAKDEKVETIKIKDFSKTNLLKNYVGNVDGFDAILLSNKYFIASNKSDFVGSIKNSNSKEILFYIPKSLYILLNLFKVEDIDILKYEELIYLTFNDYDIFIPSKDYVLPDIFDDKFVALITHNHSCTFDKNSFVECLKRISITTQGNLFNRTFLTFTEEEVVIENKDIGYAIEKIKHTFIDQELIGLTIAVSSQYMNLIMGSLEGDIVKIFATNDEESSTIKITDNKSENFFIHILYEKTEF